MLPRWYSIALVERYSSPPTSRLERPAATSAATAASRGVSPRSSRAPASGRTPHADSSASHLVSSGRAPSGWSAPARTAAVMRRRHGARFCAESVRRRARTLPGASGESSSAAACCPRRKASRACLTLPRACISDRAQPPPAGHSGSDRSSSSAAVSSFTRLQQGLDLELEGAATERRHDRRRQLAPERGQQLQGRCGSPRAHARFAAATRAENTACGSGASCAAEAASCTCCSAVGHSPRPASNRLAVACANGSSQTCSESRASEIASSA